MDAPAPKARGLAGSIQPRERAPVGPDDVALEVGLDAAERLARQQVHAHGDQRPARRVQQLVGRRDAAARVGPVLPPVADQHHLRVLAVAVCYLGVARLDHGEDLGGVQLDAAYRAGEVVHAGH